MKFFSVGPDFENGDVWRVRFTDRKANVWAYLNSSRASDATVEHLTVARTGSPAELFFTLGFHIPVVSSRLCELLQPIVADAVQFIPARIDGRDGWYIVNSLRLIDGIDTARSDFRRYGPTDPARPNEIYAMLKLVVDPARIPDNAHVLRLAGWDLSLVVSQQVADLLLREETNGIVIEGVNPPPP